MNPYLVFIVAVMVGRWVLEFVADRLNVRHIREELPGEFEGYCDAEKYRKSQSYLRDRTHFDGITDTFNTFAMLAFVLAGGFNLVDRLARGLGWSAIPTGLIFTGVLALGSHLLQLPFALYDTFRLEEKYGFNKTTPRTFWLDQIKSLALLAAIGGPIFAAILWFFDRTGQMAWLYCWAAVAAFEVFIVFIAPYVIMPLFNKFTPLEEGPLRSAIEDYATGQRFRMKGVFKMDGSKRSAKTNAFFTGFGRSRRIVLYDTLIAKHTVPELLAVVAHEMGHYKLRHIPLGMLRGILAGGVTFYLMSLFIDNAGLAAAFRLEHVSIYASLVCFGFLYTPLALAISIVESAISRRHEYAADAFAARTTGAAPAMVTALKKLSVDNLSNLTPHPFKVFLSYSHPPVLERIRAIGKAEAVS